MAEKEAQPIDAGARERIRKHFLEYPDSPERWDSLWKDGSFLPWDRGTPNPALVDVLESRKDIIGESLVAATGDKIKRRKRALVPGCGRGYDVLLLASFGYDAVGLDGSENAIQACKKLEKEEGEKYPSRVGPDGRGSIQFVVGDFFNLAWEKDLEFEDHGGFDLIYDYTFLCALPPFVRPDWSGRIAELLSKTGYLICLEFPINKPPSTGGPPWGLVPEVYVQHLTWPGEAIKYNDEGYVVEEEGRVPSDKRLVRVAHWMPDRTHAVGQGTDWVGIWKHASA